MSNAIARRLRFTPGKSRLRRSAVGDRQVGYGAIVDRFYQRSRIVWKEEFPVRRHVKAGEVAIAPTRVKKIYFCVVRRLSSVRANIVISGGCQLHQHAGTERAGTT